MASISYTGNWELVKSIDIPSIVDKPLVCGLISDDEICVRDKLENVYVTNISTEHTEKVIEGDDRKGVTSCAPVNSNVIVCGKWGIDRTDDSLDEGITLYDRQWKVIRNIPIPWSKFSTDGTVYVDVDRDGMILAAQYKQYDIYVINPTDGKIVNTIKMKGNEVFGEIQALSSGDIVLETAGEVLKVISRSGEEKAVIDCDEWSWVRCYVGKLTDTLYITYLDDYEDMMCAVDQVSCDGNIQARKIVEYEQSDDWNHISSCLVTSSDNMVVCNGDELLLYKKKFTM